MHSRFSCVREIENALICHRRYMGLFSVRTRGSFAGTSQILCLLVIIHSVRAQNFSKN